MGKEPFNYGDDEEIPDPEDQGDEDGIVTFKRSARSDADEGIELEDADLWGDNGLIEVGEDDVDEIEGEIRQPWDLDEE